MVGVDDGTVAGELRRERGPRGLRLLPLVDEPADLVLQRRELRDLLLDVLEQADDLRLERLPVGGGQVGGIEPAVDRGVPRAECVEALSHSAPSR